jgi:hypothetical protein
MTDEALSDVRHGWAKMGFLSRFIVFSNSYGIPKVIEIFKRYTEGGVEQPSIDFELP